MTVDEKQIFDPWKTFYESPEEQAAIKERAKIRDVMKAEFRKQYTNPFKPTPAPIHDPALQRHFSAQVTYAEYLRPSPRLGLLAAAFLGFSGVLFFLRKHLGDKKLSKIQNNELSYRERWGGNVRL
uniref:NADH dehydrogenase [ubiquinone] 1 beta subcomplex subunit 4 n=1 Tax=Trichobilharzia regenti TaxID=157069 RepID=A0AA85JKA1_TRIRE|nr:unnamed protein product [Trichobilharzia regenti]